MTKRAYKIYVTGMVQGVGFRPFVYRLARSMGLAGYVRNLGGSEVEIHVEGQGVFLEEFLERLRREKPPPARIESVEVRETDPLGMRVFEIRKSLESLSRRSIIPPDLGICDDCAREILSPGSRFYGYPWNSCAWCGPRFSMIERLPYDRENTSMRDFPLCEQCSRDYHDPDNTRRFHAQGISCGVCGPRTHVYGIDGRRIETSDPIGFIASVIEEGSIVAIKGVGGYHIACLATRDDVVLELRRRKERPTRPFALMARDYSVVEKIAVPPPGARELLESPERPILLLPKKEGSPISEHVAPGLDTIGVMLPYTGFQLMLLKRVRDGVLIMTSGNRRGRPMCTTLDRVMRELRGIVDYVVEHDRRIVHRVDDSVIRFTDGQPTFIRRARGYAPVWVRVGFKLKEGVAVGGELQMAGAVCFEDKVVPTQFIGDLDEPGQLEELEKELTWLISNYRVKPEFIALDMHPAYHNRELAVKLAEEFGASLIVVQHHHAHAASVMAEHRVPLGEKRVAITIDGVGLGDDGGVWGGEVLLASYESYERVGSLEPYFLPGGNTAVLQPVKPLISLLRLAGLEEEEVVSLLVRKGLLENLPHGENEARLTYRLSEEGRSPQATSLGRVLDAFSALLGVCCRRTYEGEPAIRLEAAARGGRDLGFTPRIKTVHGRFVVDLSGLVVWVLENIDAPVQDLAVTIQLGLGRALGEIALKHASKSENKIMVSGGAAVNTYIIRGLKHAVEKNDCKVILPRKLPPGDGGLAVGQAVIASVRISG